MVTFSDSFHTPNVTVTGCIWEASSLWWKHLLYHDNFFICLPCNCTQKVSARLFTQVGHEFRRVVVKKDCQEAIYKATHPVHWIGSQSRTTSRPTASFKIITSVTVVRYFRAAPLCVHGCFRRHTSERSAQQCALSKDLCVRGMHGSLAPFCSKNIIISFNHLCNIITSLKTFTNIYILLSDTH
jgi:hypothetical protein